ncbi:MAG: VOC family protein [Acidimicrobiia bacterium]
MITHIETVAVYASDQHRATSFFVDQLGFELRKDTPMGPTEGDPRWIEVPLPEPRPYSCSSRLRDSRIRSGPCRACVPLRRHPRHRYRTAGPGSQLHPRAHQYKPAVSGCGHSWWRSRRWD